MFSIKEGKQEVTQNAFDLLTILHPDFKFNIKKTSPLKNSTDLLNTITQYFKVKDLTAFSEVNQFLNQLVKKSEDSNSLSTYAKFQQKFKTDQLLNKVIQLENKLSHQRIRTPDKEIFSCSPGFVALAFVIGLVIAGYLASEIFFIYKIYDNDEYHIERNATICANINNNHTAAAYAKYMENGCRDKKQTFILVSTLYGIFAPIVTLGIFIIVGVCCLGNLNCWDYTYTNIKKGKEVEISQKEWKNILDDLNKLLKILSVSDKDKKESKIAIETLNKKKLPITKLKETIGNVKNNLTLISSSFFKRQQTTNDDLVINIPNERMNHTL